jgi:hypothetical protein
MFVLGVVVPTKELEVSPGELVDDTIVLAGDVGPDSSWPES